MKLVEDTRSVIRSVHPMVALVVGQREEFISNITVPLRLLYLFLFVYR